MKYGECVSKLLNLKVISGNMKKEIHIDGIKAKEINFP